MTINRVFKLSICWIIFLQTLSAMESFQIEPNSFLEIDARYESLVGSGWTDISQRPYMNHGYPTNSSIFLQLRPTVSANDFDHFSTWFQAGITSNVVLVNEMVLRSIHQNQGTYLGKTWRGMSGYTNQSFLFWQRDFSRSASLNIQLGRFYRQQGPGRHGQLLMGAGNRPMDQMALAYTKKFSDVYSVQFDFQTSALDKVGQSQRFLSLHRLGIYTGVWYFSFSEALTYARSQGGLDFVYLNPFLFYHGVQSNGPDLAGNTLGTIEMGLRFGSSRVYAELLIDDIQLDAEEKGDLEPNEIGGMLGLEHAGDKFFASIEGIAITNRTYKTPSRSEWYLHRNDPIGYELGSDLQRLNGLLRYYLSPHWHVDLEMDFLWQGEGLMTKPWDEPWQDNTVTLETGYSEPFPTGIVEFSTTVGLEMMRHWSAQRWVSIGLNYQVVENLENENGASYNNVGFELGISWVLEYYKEFE